MEKGKNRPFDNEERSLNVLAALETKNREKIEKAIRERGKEENREVNWQTHWLRSMLNS